VRQGEIHRIRAFGAEIPTLPIRIRESLGEEHHALGIRVVMAEAQGMPEFVNRGLHGTFHEFVFAIASELGKGDDRPSTSNIRMAEDQRQSELRVTELRIRDRDDAIAVRGLAGPIERRRSVPFRHEAEGPSR